MTILKHSASRLILLLPFFIFWSDGEWTKSQKKSITKSEPINWKTNPRKSACILFLIYDFLPTVHKFGINKVGVFTPLETDTTIWQAYRCVNFRMHHSISSQNSMICSTAKEEYDPKTKEYVNAEYTNPTLWPYWIRFVAGIFRHASNGSPSIRQCSLGKDLWT